MSNMQDFRHEAWTDERSPRNLLDEVAVDQKKKMPDGRQLLGNQAN
jgi:hypothetical protein